MEVFIYQNADVDGCGGSSYIDVCVYRERDADNHGDLDTRLYYLQNWRHDVVTIMGYNGAISERMFYDAYGRPHSFSPGDIKTAGGSLRPDGVLNSSDTWSSGSVAWNKDIGNSDGDPIPDGASNTDDGFTVVNLRTAGYTGGYGLLSASSIGNRKGYAGYEFDPVLNGAAGTDTKPVYHVRHRVLASDTGKWLQKDPLGYHDGMDLYEYCRSDAVDKLDRKGLACGTSCNGCTASIANTSAGKSLVSGGEAPLRFVRLALCVQFCANAQAAADIACQAAQADCYRQTQPGSANRLGCDATYLECKKKSNKCGGYCVDLCAGRIPDDWRILPNSPTRDPSDVIDCDASFGPPADLLPDPRPSMPGEAKPDGPDNRANGKHWLCWLSAHAKAELMRQAARLEWEECKRNNPPGTGQTAPFTLPSDPCSGPYRQKLDFIKDWLDGKIKDCN